MGKRVFLHIGPHKTGTTSIQATLRFNRDYLETCGICYLPVGLGPTPDRMHGQHNLAWALSGDRRRLPDGATWDDALRHIERAPFDDFVISSEAFSTFDTAMTRRLADILAGCEVGVIYTLRRHVDLMNSAYGQGAVKWNPHRLARWFAGHIDKWRQGSLSHAPKIAPWIEVFGWEALRLPIFEEIKGDLATGALRFVDRPFEPARIVPHRLNAARSMAHIRLNIAICRALGPSVRPAFYREQLAPLLSTVAAKAPVDRSPAFYVPLEAQRAMAPLIEDEIDFFERRGVILPESYRRQERAPTVTDADLDAPPELGRRAAAALIALKRHGIETRTLRRLFQQTATDAAAEPRAVLDACLARLDAPAPSPEEARAILEAGLDALARPRAA